MGKSRDDVLDLSRMDVVALDLRERLLHVTHTKRTFVVEEFDERDRSVLVAEERRAVDRQD